MFVNCKNIFMTKEMWERFMMIWNLRVVSYTEEYYFQHLALLKKQFSTYLDALHYVKNTWLDGYRDKFVVA